jgi:hypothetical protein
MASGGGDPGRVRRGDPAAARRAVSGDSAGSVERTAVSSGAPRMAEREREGPFTLQHGAGVIKFRKVAIKPL